jgi:hypothetical protein
LEREHLAAVGLVVVAAEVEDAVHDGLGQVLCVVRADDDVSQLARLDGRPGLINREGQHVGGLVASPVLAVELRDPRGIYQLDGEVPVLDAGGG